MKEDDLTCKHCRCPLEQATAGLYICSGYKEQYKICELCRVAVKLEVKKNLCKFI